MRQPVVEPVRDPCADAICADIDGANHLELRAQTPEGEADLLDRPARVGAIVVKDNLFEGITFDLPEISDGRILTDEENAGIRQGAMRLYCFGCVDYTDISESARVKKTAFCRVLEVPKTPRSYQDVGRLVVHHDADYEYQD